jgi:hypothetical protein
VAGRHLQLCLAQGRTATGLAGMDPFPSTWLPRGTDRQPFSAPETDGILDENFLRVLAQSRGGQSVAGGWDYRICR